MSDNDFPDGRFRQQKMDWLKGLKGLRVDCCIRVTTGEGEPPRKWLGWLPCVVCGWTALTMLAGCGASAVVTRNAGALGATAVGSVAPSAEIEQTYYLGSFDPRDQLPPAIYRIRVRGQSSILNATRFASSWVPAEVVDSLTGSLAIDPKSGKVTVDRQDGTVSSLSDAGRRLMLFGPEGFREAPAGHRLVVIMGGDPQMVEQAFSEALGSVAQVKFGRAGVPIERDIFALLLALGQEREQLNAVAEGR